MTGNALRRPDARLSVADAKAQLTMMLLNCSDERLAAHSVESLAAMYRVKPSEIDVMLTAERGRRVRPL